MIENIRIVAYGRPATQALAELVAAAKSDNVRQTAGPLAPVTVVVPSNFAGLTARRVLGAGMLGGAGIANVSFLTPFRLAELTAADLPQDRRPLTNPVLGAAVRRFLATDPGPLAPVADHQATEAALAALYTELSHVSKDTLTALASAGGPAALAVRCYRGISSSLSGFYGEEDLLIAATTRPDLAHVTSSLGRLIWYLPEPSKSGTEHFLRAVFATADTDVLVGITGDNEADAGVLATCKAVGVDVQSSTVHEISSPVASRIVSVTDADEEVRAVVRRIVELLEDGIWLDRIGVFFPTPDPYLRVLCQQFAEAGLPCNGPTQQRLAERVAGRTLLAALALPTHQWRRDRVMALISGTPVRYREKPIHPSAWEALSRRAGVVAGLGDWQHKLASFVTRIDAALAKASDDGNNKLADRLRRDRADAEILADFVKDLAAATSQVAQATTWSSKVTAAKSLLGHLLGTTRHRMTWPEVEQAAVDRVEDALSRLADLDEIDPNPSMGAFSRALRAEFSVPGGRHGTFGEGVTYGPLSAAVGQDLDAVFVLGMSEGQCPAQRRDDALLPDSARNLTSNAELPLRATAIDREHRLFLAMLASAPPERRCITFARGDLRGGGHSRPSRWLLDTAKALAGARIHSSDFASLGAPLIEVVPSYTAGLHTAPVLASLVERDVAVLARHVALGGDPQSHPVSALVAGGLACLAARQSNSFTAWDGNLAGCALLSPAHGEILSATRLESWAVCGFQYFLRHVLGLAGRDDPEHIRVISPIDRGSLVHVILERFLRWVISNGAPSPDEPWNTTHRERLQAFAKDAFVEYERAGRTGRPINWRVMKDELSALLDNFLDADDVCRKTTRCQPAHAEMAFGMDGRPPVEIELSDGRRIRFRGKADRVDVAESGHHIVFDYKTGQGNQYKRIEQGDPVRAGHTLQLGLYAQAARQILGATEASAYYWLINSEAAFSQHGYAWDDVRRSRLVEAIEAIVDGIEAGVFPYVPGEWSNYDNAFENCRRCDFDDLCLRSRNDHATVKAGAPELALRGALERKAGDAT